MRMIDREFARGGIIMIIAFGLYNFLNFMFHLSMARMLSIADYGILVALFSIIYFLSLFTESIQTVVAGKVSKNSDTRPVFLSFSRKLTAVSIGLFVFYLAIALVFSRLMKIDYWLLSLNGLMVFASFLLPINRGILQGAKKFFSLGNNMVIESSIKIILAMILVYIGFSVYGAITATIIGSLCAYFISFVGVKNTFQKDSKVSKKKISYNYTNVSFLLILLLMIFYSIDVVMVKIMFNADLAGSYAIASTLAKTVFFGAAPIGKVMFSIISSEKKDNKRKSKVLMNSFMLVIAGIVAALFLFYLFPAPIVKIFSGKDVPAAVAILFPLAIANSFIALTNLNVLYKLSSGLEYNKLVLGTITFIIAVLLEIFLLIYFSDNLIEFSVALIASSCFLFLVSLKLLK